MEFVKKVLEIPGLITGNELQFLVDVAETAPLGSVVDLGTFQGRSAAALCGTVGHHRVVTIDNWVMQHHGVNNQKLARENLKKMLFTPRFVTGLSWEIPPEVDQVAMIFIDTDHRDFILRKELKVWLPLLVEGGIVAMHDYRSMAWPTLTLLIDQQFIEPEWHRIGVVEMLIAFRWEGEKKA